MKRECLMKFNQGYFVPKNPQKYVGDVKNIVYRSGLEKRFFKFLDEKTAILSWGSEEFFIPYFSPVDRKMHRYFPDIIFKMKDKNGEEKTFVAEIKPDSQTRPPKTGSKKKKSTLIRESLTWAVNDAKWKAAIKWCEEKNFEFIILTEKDLKEKH